MWFIPAFYTCILLVGVPRCTWEQNLRINRYTTGACHRCQTRLGVSYPVPMILLERKHDGARIIVSIFQVDFQCSYLLSSSSVKAPRDCISTIHLTGLTLQEYFKTRPSYIVVRKELHIYEYKGTFSASIEQGRVKYVRTQDDTPSHLEKEKH